MRIVPTLDLNSVRDIDRDPREPWIGEPATAAVAPGASLPLGETLLRDGLLDADDVARILALQERKGLRFGEAALKLRLIKPKDLERALARQFLQPGIEPGGGLSRELVAMYRPTSRQIELLCQSRSLLTQYWFAVHPALAIVSPGHGEGRSYLAANLAVLVARLGRQALLIDGDMRRPRQHNLFGVKNRIGLSHVLAGRVRPAEAAQRVPGIGTLAVLAAGAAPPNPLELLDRGGMPAVLRELSQQFSAILVDTPPGNRYGDARVLADCCRGVVMLLRRHHTRVRDAKHLAGLLLHTQVKLVGTVLNRF
jgi:protein-tyrosine kinase